MTEPEKKKKNNEPEYAMGVEGKATIRSTIGVPEIIVKCHVRHTRLILKLAKIYAHVD